MATGNGSGFGVGDVSGVKINVLGQFVRDLSFENIAMQRGDFSQKSPKTQVQVNLDAKNFKETGNYQVIIKLNIESKKMETDKPIFLLELEYAGLFRIENVPSASLHQFLMVECPRQMFPFLRRIVADVTRDGGYPPFNLDVIDFAALYKQEVKRRAAGGNVVRTN